MRRGAGALGGRAGVQCALAVVACFFFAAVLVQMAQPSAQWGMARARDVAGRQLISRTANAGGVPVPMAHESPPEHEVSLPGLNGGSPQYGNKESLAAEAPHEAPRFYIYPDSIFGPDVQPTWSPFPEVDQELSCFVDMLEGHHSRTQKPEEASTFIVPLYRLSHVVYPRNKETSAIEVALRELRRRLNGTTWYIKYGGANHVFVFPHSLPERIMRVVIDVLDVDLYSFWVGTGPLQTGLNWRCTHKRIRFFLPLKPKSCVDKSRGRRLQGKGGHGSLAEADASSDGCSDDPLWCKQSVESMLKEMWYKTLGRRVWDCVGAVDTPTNIVGEYYQAGGNLKRLAKGTYVDEGHKMTMCVIAKCASTVLKMMQKRVTGDPTWDARDVQTRKRGLVRVAANASVERFHDIYDNPQWLKVAVVRDPVLRCLSGYLQKIVQLQQYFYLHWKGSRQPTFHEYVQILYSHPVVRSNEHFLEQSASCGFRMLHTSFIARVETLHDDFKELYERLGIWEEFGASGWGEDGKHSFLEVFEASANHPARLESSAGDVAAASYYTRDTLELVYKMYREDFDRFGYSIEKWRRLVDQHGAGVRNRSRL
eukprot:evm.model.scf_1490.1 EVM.evm.TU.scf_1490.1   scf_1490:16200-19766(+)